MNLAKTIGYILLTLTLGTVLLISLVSCSQQANRDVFTVHRIKVIESGTVSFIRIPKGGQM